MIGGILFIGVLALLVIPGTVLYLLPLMRRKR